MEKTVWPTCSAGLSISSLFSCPMSPRRKRFSFIYFHLLSITLEIENGTCIGSKPGRAGGPKADFHGQLHWSLCLSSCNARCFDPSESNSRFKLWISGRFWVQKIGPHSVDLDKLTQVWAHVSWFFEAAMYRRWRSITMRRKTPIFTRWGIVYFALN